MRSSLVAVLILLATVGSVFAPVINAGLGLNFLSTRGTLIVDSTGQAIILRGVNYPGYEQRYPKLHSSVAYNTLAGFEFNVVRLLISWANLEPQPSTFNSTYLSAYVDRDIEWARSAGIYVILGMSQYDWAAEFGGNGAPDWAVRNYASNTTGMQQAVSNFWINATLQEHLAVVWTNIAQRYANESAIAGYDLFNEPVVYIYNGQGGNASSVDSLYARLVNTIRSVDARHIIFLEPANTKTARQPFTNIVWSPHFYQLSYAPKYNEQDFMILEKDFIQKYKTFLVDSSTPMWIGEFGAFMPDDSSRANWTQDALTLFNRYRIGWAWWAYNGQYTSIPDQLYVPG
jgi:endoglycosylceramidase